MINEKLKYISEEDLTTILEDAFEWLVNTFEDNSIITNKLNYSKKYSPLKRVTFKQHLSLVWDYNSRNLGWKSGKQFGLFDFNQNKIYLHCNKNSDLQTVLSTLFHEYCHTQQNSRQYAYYRLVYKHNYYEHPLEVEAELFHLKYLPIFLNQYKKI